MDLTESIRFIISPQDKDLLQRIAELERDRSMSSVLRKLIYREALRRGLVEAKEEKEPV